MDLEVQPEADSTTVGNVKGGCSRFACSPERERERMCVRACPHVLLSLVAVGL